LGLLRVTKGYTIVDTSYERGEGVNMKEYIEPKEGDTRGHCPECRQSITVLYSDTKGRVKVVDNGKTIPQHYRFGIDLMGGGEGVSWLCSGSGQNQVTYVYQPTCWDIHGKGFAFRFEPVGWKPKPKKSKK
jgi:hypothetical protein